MDDYGRLDDYNFLIVIQVCESYDSSDQSNNHCERLDDSEDGLDERCYFSNTRIALCFQRSGRKQLEQLEAAISAINVVVANAQRSVLHLHGFV